MPTSKLHRLLPIARWRTSAPLRRSGPDVMTYAGAVPATLPEAANVA
jgi:hypothetical protein